MTYSVFTRKTGQPMIRHLTFGGQSGSRYVQIITHASEGRIGRPDEELFPPPKWSMLADEMVSLHRARTHWGLWGVRHIWANRLLMSCLHEPLIMALERDISTRGFEVAICCGSAIFGLALDNNYREQTGLFAEMCSLLYLIQIHWGQMLYINKGCMKLYATCCCNLHVP